MKKTVLMIVSAVMATMMAMIATGCGSSSSEVSKTAPTIPKATNATTAPVHTRVIEKHRQYRHHHGDPCRIHQGDRGDGGDCGALR